MAYQSTINYPRNQEFHTASLDAPTSPSSIGVECGVRVACEHSSRVDHLIGWPLPVMHTNGILIGTGNVLVETLPSELWQEIFLYSVARKEQLRFMKERTAHIRPQESFNIAPMVLAQICGYLRRVALDIPLLWSQIDVYGPAECHTHLVSLWLARSGSETPLSLSLGQSFQDDSAQPVCDIIEMLIQHSHRWKSIDFRFLTGEPLKVLFKLRQGDMPLLESAVLTTVITALAVDKQIWKAIYSSPSLRRVEWDFVRGMPIEAPWTTLTHIKMTYTSKDFLLAALANCPQIEEFHAGLVILSRPLPTTQPRPTICLPKLHTFSVRTSFDVAQLFDRLQAPALLDLGVVQESKRRQTPNQQACEAFLQRSGCYPTSLDLLDHEIAERDLLQFLSCPALGRLENLSVNASVRNSLVRALTGEVLDEEWSGLFPRLKTVRLFNCCTSNGVVGRLAAMRMDPDGYKGTDNDVVGCKLERFEVTFQELRKTHHATDVSWFVYLGGRPGLHLQYRPAGNYRAAQYLVITTSLMARMY